MIYTELGFMSTVDWIIDLGPGAGNDGGRIVFKAPRPSWWARRERRGRP